MVPSPVSEFGLMGFVVTFQNMVKNVQKQNKKRWTEFDFITFHSAQLFWFPIFYSAFLSV